MQVQDYLPFFQDLLVHYIQSTLADPVYASCIAIVVWLVTAVFYSIRIGFLNRRNRIMLKARLDLQNELAATQQQIQALQEEIVANQEQIAQEQQRTAAQQERIAELASLLSESIVAMAAEPELGQQGLTVSPGLEVEHLWQRFSGAVKLVGENLIAERKAKAELQEAISAETAKLAEKDLQLQATQTRFDLQKQQLAKLEAAAEEHKAQLAEQSAAADRRLAEAEAKYRNDLARLEQHAQDLKVAKPQPAAVAVKAPEPPVAKPEQPKPVEIKAEAVAAPAVQSEPQAVKVEAKPTVTEPVAVAQPVKAEKASGGVTGKFKSLFAGAKERMEKLDGKLGVSDPQSPVIEADQSEPEVAIEVVPTAAEPELPIETAPQAEAAVKAEGAGLGGKFKSMFGSSKKAAVEAEPVIEDVVVEEAVAEPEPQAEKAAPAGKIKGLFGKFKR